MSRHAMYVIGEPGAGKSTLVDHLTRGLPYEESEQPFAHRRYESGVFELGRRRSRFSGTDALAMNVQPEAVRFIEGVRPALLLAEGDRLANNKFFEALVELEYDLRIYYLAGPERAKVQRELRAGEEPQDPSWVAGRITKVRRLAERWAARTSTIPVGARLADLEAMLDDPVSAALKAGRLVTA